MKVTHGYNNTNKGKVTIDFNPLCISLRRWCGFRTYCVCCLESIDVSVCLSIYFDLFHVFCIYFFAWNDNFFCWILLNLCNTWSKWCYQFPSSTSPRLLVGNDYMDAKLCCLFHKEMKEKITKENWVTFI